MVKRVEKLFSCCTSHTGVAEAEQGVTAVGPVPLGRADRASLSYIASVQVKYTLFTAAGVPVRATCTVTLEEIAGDPPKQNPTSGGLVPRRVHVLIEGDTLAGIAYNEYGDAVPVAGGRGRQPASTIPMRLRPGTSVLLPAVNELPCRGAAGRPAGRGPGGAPWRTVRNSATCCWWRSPGSRFPRTSPRGWCPATSTTAATSPTCSCSASATSTRTVLDKAEISIGAPGQAARPAERPRRPRPAAVRRSHGPRDGNGPRRPVHDRPRPGPFPPAVPRTPRRGLPAEHRRGHRPQGRRSGPESRPARSTPKAPCCSTSPRTASVTGTSCTGWRSRPGWSFPCPAARCTSPRRRTPRPRRAEAGGARNEPLVLQRGVNLVSPAGNRHLRGPGPRRGGPGLGRRGEAGDSRRRPGKDPQRQAARRGPRPPSPRSSTARGTLRRPRPSTRRPSATPRQPPSPPT